MVLRSARCPGLAGGGLREPGEGAAPPQPALPGAGPAHQSRGQPQPPSCREGESRSSEGRVPKGVRRSAAARDRGALRHAAAPPRERRARLRHLPADSEVGPAPLGAYWRPKAENQLVWTAANRDANPSTPISCLWSDSLGATRSAEMSSRPEQATAEGLGVQANKQKVRGQNNLKRRE